MRCQFCGWENPETKSTCEKCNQPLQQTSSLGKSTVMEANAFSESSSRSMHPKDSFNPKATVREKSTKVETAPDTCPACGYNLDGEDICPCCGTKKGTEEGPAPTSDFKKTVRPNHNHRFNHDQKVSEGFRLVKLSDSGLPSGSVSFGETEVSLTRENTDSKNQTITSQTQAIVKKVDDKWMITDQSALRSTFVQAVRPIELQDGDLILLGDQLFRFESN